MRPAVLWLIALLAAQPLVANAQLIGLRLRMDPVLHPPPAEDDVAGESVLFIEADEVSGKQGEDVEARGNVKLRARGRSLFADRIVYSQTADRVTATGNVRLDRLGDVMEGTRVEVDLAKDTAVADSPEYFFRQLNARGKAQRIMADGRSRIHADQGTYSTCVVPEKDWYMRVRKLDLDRDKDEGVARHATVYFKNIPFLYTPYIDFPLSNQRKTGFLSPTYGTTGKSGFEFTLPFYWNLAPNYDATIAPRMLAKRGLMLNNEFRYLGSTFSGMASAEYLPNDEALDGVSRYALAYRHNHQLTSKLNGHLFLQRASDNRYFVDLSNRLAVTSITNLPREGGLTYNGGFWTLAGRTQKYQTLQDPLAPITPPYARLPQITLTGLRPNVGGYDLGLNAEFVHFSHPTLLNGRRLIAYPSIAYPIQRSFFSVVPKIGLHQTFYDLEAGSGYSSTARTMPIFTVDGTVMFERNTSFLGTPLLQTLEPRLYYVYIPYRDQSRLPVFDTAVGDFNFAQIFSENQFVGGDRINDANQVTGAVSSRLIDPLDGRERLRLTLGQRFFFGDQRVTLGSTQARTQNRSDILAAVTGRMTPAWYADVAMRLDINDRRPDRSTFVLRYNPEPGHVLNFGYRFNRDTFEQTDISTQWMLGERWSAVARWAYSLRDRRSTTTIAGLEYNAGCWVGRFVMQQFVTFTQDSVRALFFQLELNGLSKIGSNPLDILRQNITGYQKINALSQSQFNEDYYPVQ